MPEEDTRNVGGDFYVERDCCTLCGVPWHFAPTLFDHDEMGCWVAKQPTTEDEERLMVKVCATQELGCIRYRGSDVRVLSLLQDSGAADSIERPSRPPAIAAPEPRGPLSLSRPLFESHDRVQGTGLWQRAIAWLKGRQ